MCVLKIVGVSAMSGAGMDDLFKAIEDAADEYEREYRPMLARKLAERVASCIFVSCCCSSRST